MYIQVSQLPMPKKTENLNTVSMYIIVILIFVLVIIGLVLSCATHLYKEETAHKLIVSSSRMKQQGDQFWTPISISFERDLTITFCKLNFLEHRYNIKSILLIVLWILQYFKFFTYYAERYLLLRAARRLI